MRQHPTVKFTPLELDGEKYKLAFDFNAIAEAEAATGLNLLQALDFHGLNAQQYRGLLYAALLKAQPKTTADDAGALITLPNLSRITNALLSAWGASLPNPLEPEQTPADESK